MGEPTARMVGPMLNVRGAPRAPEHAPFRTVDGGEIEVQFVRPDRIHLPHGMGDLVADALAGCVTP